MPSIGKGLLLIGLFFLAAGALFLIAGKLSLPLGLLPGDMIVRGKRFVLYAPITTMLLVSLAASALLTLLIRWMK